jgi:hypothetical protein
VLCVLISIVVLSITKMAVDSFLSSVLIILSIVNAKDVPVCIKFVQ